MKNSAHKELHAGPLRGRSPFGFFPDFEKTMPSLTQVLQITAYIKFVSSCRIWKYRLDGLKQSVQIFSGRLVFISRGCSWHAAITVQCGFAKLGALKPREDAAALSVWVPCIHCGFQWKQIDVPAAWYFVSLMEACGRKPRSICISTSSGVSGGLIETCNYKAWSAAFLQSTK